MCNIHRYEHERRSLYGDARFLLGYTYVLLFDVRCDTVSARAHVLLCVARYDTVFAQCLYRTDRPDTPALHIQGRATKRRPFSQDCGSRACLPKCATFAGVAPASSLRSAVGGRRSAVSATTGETSRSMRPRRARGDVLASANRDATVKREARVCSCSSGEIFGGNEYDNDRVLGDRRRSAMHLECVFRCWMYCQTNLGTETLPRKVNTILFDSSCNLTQF